MASRRRIKARRKASRARRAQRHNHAIYEPSKSPTRLPRVSRKTKVNTPRSLDRSRSTLISYRSNQYTVRAGSRRVTRGETARVAAKQALARRVSSISATPVVAARFKANAASPKVVSPQSKNTRHAPKRENSTEATLSKARRVCKERPTTNRKIGKGSGKSFVPYC